MKTLAFWLALGLLMAWLLALVGVFAASAATHLLLLGAIVLFVVAFRRDRTSVV